MGRPPLAYLPVADDPIADKSRRLLLRCTGLNHSKTCYTWSVILGLRDKPMRRRQFITLLGGAAAWPLTARAQQAERMRRIGVLSPLAADDPEERARDAAFAQGLQQLGWIVGQNVRIEYRWGRGNADAMRKYAGELVALAPDVILAGGSSARSEERR